MATPVLLEGEIERGRELLDKLISNGMPISAAFWHIDPDEERYTLYIATPVFDEVGPLSAYGMIQLAKNAIQPSKGITQALKVISQNDPVVRGLRSLGELKDSPLEKTPVPGAYFNEGYVYFVGPPIAFPKGA